MPDRDERRLVSTYDMPKAHERQEKPLRAPGFWSDFMGPVVLVFLIGLGLGWGLSDDVRWGVLAGSALALGALVWRALVTFDYPNVELRETWWQKAWLDEEPAVKDPTWVHIPDGRGGVVELRQPKGGEFANWVGAVLRDRGDDALVFREKTQLSQNTAKGRGWPVAMYKGMLAVLVKAGWVTSGRNNTPVFTDHGAAMVGRYLTARNGVTDV
jgi:hypothetical protein